MIELPTTYYGFDEFYKNNSKELSTFIVLKPCYIDEFLESLSLLEKEFNITREEVYHHQCKNTVYYGMMGSQVYIVSFKRGGRISGFKKKIRFLWGQFNNKYPDTVWCGK